MRYLPTIEFGQKLHQIAFPDVLAIELADTCLTQTGEEYALGLERILLSSPMLLFWLGEKWKLDRTDDKAVPISDDILVSEILQLLSRESHRLIKDNYKPISSVARIEIENFVKVYAFFHCRDSNGLRFSRRIVERLMVLNHCFADIIDSQNQFQKNRLLRVDFDPEMLIDDFNKTDVDQFAGLKDICSRWEIEHSAFRNGLGALDEKMERMVQLETEFEDMVERAKISAIQQLAYGASHEINNPLANISTRAQALLRDETDDKRRQRLMTIDAQAFRAHDMISNLMTFAKPRRPRIERFQIRPAVETAVENLLRMAGEHQIEIQLECESSVYLEADNEQFREIVFALVENAIESIRADGKIRVRCQLPNPNQPILVEIMDTGPGISPEVRKHIFDPFFSGREAGRGLGFGLSKVWRLMELHSGSIRLTERHGYTVVELLFPAEQPAAMHVDVEKTA